MSEEVKEKNKTTKTAKLFRFLTVLSITTLGWLICFGIYQALPQKMALDNKWAYLVILAITFTYSIVIGIKLAERWDQFKRGKKMLLGFFILIPFPCVCFLTWQFPYTNLNMFYYPSNLTNFDSTCARGWVSSFFI